MPARSEGIFPRRAAWCDVETMLPDDGSCNKFPETTSVKHSNGPDCSREINFVAYFTEDAVGTIDVVDCFSSEVIATLDAARAINGKAITVRAGYELEKIGTGSGETFEASPLDEFKRTDALTAGSARVFIF